jgi:hypothetical protein
MNGFPGGDGFVCFPQYKKPWQTLNKNAGISSQNGNNCRQSNGIDLKLQLRKLRIFFYPPKDGFAPGRDSQLLIDVLQVFFHGMDRDADGLRNCLIGAAFCEHLQYMAFTVC